MTAYVCAFESVATRPYVDDHSLRSLLRGESEELLLFTVIIKKGVDDSL